MKKRTSDSHMDTTMEDARPPRPYHTLTTSGLHGRLQFSTLFGRGEEKSLFAGVDVIGGAVVYDLDTGGTLHGAARLSEMKQFEPITLAAGDALYLMNRNPLLGSSGFETLLTCGGDRPAAETEAPGAEGWRWRWRSLPRPPFVLDRDKQIGAYAVVGGGSSIWISTPEIDTYPFDTASGAWGEMGGWELPFDGRADYVPEYGLWLGFRSRHGLLCSSDLAASSARREPLLQNAWEDLDAPEDWMPVKSQLVNLGRGMFCVAQTERKESFTESASCLVAEPREDRRAHRSDAEARRVRAVRQGSPDDQAQVSSLQVRKLDELLGILSIKCNIPQEKSYPAAV